MDESVEEIFLGVTRPTSKLAIASSILGVIKRIIGVFFLTDEEKLEAGIDLDNYHESHDARQIVGQSDSSDGFRTKGRIC